MTDYDDALAQERETNLRLIAQLRESEARFRAIADTMPQMVWSTTPDGLHDYFNARWYAFTGAPAGSTDGDGWNDMFHPDDQQRAWAQWRHCLETGDPYEIEYRLRHHSGTYRWVLGRALPIRDDGGVITRWFGTCTDIDQQVLDRERRSSDRLRLELALDAGDVGTWVYDPAGAQFEGDPRCLRILGSADDTASAMSLDAAILGRLSAEDQDVLSRALDGTVQGIRCEVRVTGEGRDRWVAWTGRLLERAGSGPVIVGTVRDVTAEREAAAEREIITQELSHRIKNIFSIVSGMIAATARAHPELKPLSDDLRDRIGALGQAHEFVRTQARSAPKSERPASLHGLLRELSAPYSAREGGGVTIAGDDVVIDDRSVTPLALVFHELMTNAAKYGGLSGDGDGVSLTTRLDNEIVHVEWAERARHATVTPTTQGFGSRLIALSIENQLGGRIDREWRETGLVCRIEIPAGSLSRP